jgi:putative addiction module component (TIGR02574 family)
MFAVENGGFMTGNLKNEIKKLSIAERIILVEEIWDGIARENEAFILSQAQQDELERRSAEFHQHPDIGRSWEEIRAEFLGGR